MSTIEISGRNTEIWPSTREYMEKKLKKIQKLARHVDHVEIRLSQNKTTFAVDVRVNADHSLYSASGESEKVRVAVDAAMEKIERQLVEDHGKRRARRGDSAPEAGDASDAVEDEFPEEIAN